MYIDKENLYSDGQAITGDAVSSNVIDHGEADTGVSDQNVLVVQATEDFDSAADGGTLAIELETADAEDFSDAKVVVKTDPIAQADLVAGARVLQVKLPVGMKRYSRINYDNGGEAFTAGKVSAAIVRDADAWRAYPANTGS